MSLEPRSTKTDGLPGPRTRHPRVVGSLCVVAASALLLAGCGGSDNEEGAPSPARATQSPTVSSAAPSASSSMSASPSATASSRAPLTEDQAERKALIPAAKIAFLKAADTAVGKVPGSKLAELELKGTSGSADTGHPQWIAKVASKDGTAHTVRIDAVSGKVIRSETDPDQDADDKRELADRLAKAKETPEAAAKVAMDKITAAGRKGTVSAIELDEKKGTLVWSVDVVTTDDWNKTTFDIDAANGDVKREHVDRD
ncbi:PepSY domain-containing protein [Streptomyces sp. AM 4-1-1]|uniref:PepSY domain-containing protein n=1 Tax=Streptomyces sp. AM 4-1-1 TaxID=3028710 RepID=UPI0023B9EB95|nr:PepSY domain-containing protein [Streptomyces sp. AM 4-1-1]WEH32025.1 PepSY domain-containing protein [Streptomyces sp. AM 4-1-1]